MSKQLGLFCLHQMEDDMKLGSQTNSLTNHILSRAVIGQPEPVVGMGATLLAWTDRHAGTIFHVEKSKSGLFFIGVREDKAIRTDKNGMSECQTYDYVPCGGGHVYYFRQTKSGTWEEVRLNDATGRYVKTGGYGLRIGERSEYRDFSF